MPDEPDGANGASAADTDGGDGDGSREMKHADHILALPEECPPDHFGEERVDVYRFVRADLGDPWNFTPQALKPTARRHAGDPVGCTDFALSMWRSEEEAKNFYLRHKKNGRKVERTFGTHLAIVRVFPVDGLIGPPRGDGHRDLHEYTSESLASRSEHVAVLFDDVAAARSTGAR